VGEVEATSDGGCLDASDLVAAVCSGAGLVQQRNVPPGQLLQVLVRQRLIPLDHGDVVELSGRSCVDELKASGKPFDISKWEVWEAFERVKANKGAPGVDGSSIEEFEKDLKNNLYKIWNRMSSGSYFPPPVLAVEIPKSHGGTRILGVPTVADRVAQTVVARRLEAKIEQIFHPDSYGYRPRRSALHAVDACRRHCWKNDWVIDLDIQKFFDSVRWDLVVKAVEAKYR
jgi:hypothetical protein